MAMSIAVPTSTYQLEGIPAEQLKKIPPDELEKYKKLQSFSEDKTIVIQLVIERLKEINLQNEVVKSKTPSRGKALLDMSRFSTLSDLATQKMDAILSLCTPNNKKNYTTALEEYKTAMRKSVPKNLLPELIQQKLLNIDDPEIATAAKNIFKELLNLKDSTLSAAQNKMIEKYLSEDHALLTIEAIEVLGSTNFVENLAKLQIYKDNYEKNNKDFESEILKQIEGATLVYFNLTVADLCTDVAEIETLKSELESIYKSFNEFKKTGKSEGFNFEELKNKYTTFLSKLSANSSKLSAMKDIKICVLTNEGFNDPETAELFYNLYFAASLMDGTNALHKYFFMLAYLLKVSDVKLCKKIAGSVIDTVLTWSRSGFFDSNIADLWYEHLRGPFLLKTDTTPQLA